MAGDASKSSCTFHGFHVRVELANKVVDDTEKLRQTLCHELCHVAGESSGEVGIGRGSCSRNMSTKCWNLKATTSVH
jgi:hypothetical protein